MKVKDIYKEVVTQVKCSEKIVFEIGDTFKILNKDARWYGKIIYITDIKTTYYLVKSVDSDVKDFLCREQEKEMLDKGFIVYLGKFEPKHN